MIVGAVLLPSLIDAVLPPNFLFVSRSVYSLVVRSFRLIRGGWVTFLNPGNVGSKNFYIMKNYLLDSGISWIVGYTLT